MAEDFEKILSSLLERYEADPGQDVDALVAEKCRELGLGEEAERLLRETNEYVDDFVEKAAELGEAKGRRESRRRWLALEIERVTDGRTEEEKAAVAEAVEQTGGKLIDNLLEGKEE